MQSIIILIVLVNIVFVTGKNCDPKKCTDYVREEHYRDLGCKPIFEKDSCCPIRYDCPIIEQMTNQIDKCHYHGNVVEEGASLKVLEGSTCSNSFCTCRRIEKNRASFVCATPLCASSAQKLGEFCREKNILGQCCPQQLCGEDPNTLKNCTFEGNEYLSGNKIYPRSDRCQQCVCENDGTVNCKKVSCDLQIHSPNKIVNFCAPIYYGILECCPSEFLCADKILVLDRTEITSANKDDELIIIERINSTNTDEEKMCKFGNKLLQIGDQLSKRGRYCLRCKCSVPPLVTCIVDSMCRP